MQASVGFGIFVSFPDWSKAVKSRGESDTCVREKERVAWRGNDIRKEDGQELASGEKQPWTPQSSWLSSRHLFCQLPSAAPVRRDRIHHSLLFFYFHISLWGWKRWAICCRCMMNFIKYSQLLLKIAGDLQNSNPTCPEQIWHTEQRCEICQKLKAVLVNSGPLWFIFFFLRRTWFYWNNDSYIFY